MAKYIHHHTDKYNQLVITWIFNILPTSHAGSPNNHQILPEKNPPILNLFSYPNLQNLPKQTHKN